MQTAQTHLEKALEVAAGAGCGVTDWEVSEHHFKLGRVLWAIGGEAKSDPEQVRVAAAMPLCLLSAALGCCSCMCINERSALYDSLCQACDELHVLSEPAFHCASDRGRW